jgi:hypothetical protein
MSYDTKCHDLAEAFLAEQPEKLKTRVADLAQTIQDAIEDWLWLREFEDHQKAAFGHSPQTRSKEG